MGNTNHTTSPEQIEFHIVVERDKEAETWFVSSCNVPGLNLESDEPWKLIKRCINAAPELIELNRQLQSPDTSLSDGDVETGAKALHEQEARIFGYSDDTEHGRANKSSLWQCNLGKYHRDARTVLLAAMKSKEQSK